MTQTRSRRARTIMRRYPSSTIWVAATFVVATANLLFDVLAH